MRELNYLNQMYQEFALVMADLAKPPCECPKCGADIKVLIDSLGEPEGSDNRDTARWIVANCDTCFALCHREIMEGR